MKCKFFKKKKPIESDTPPEGYKFDLFNELGNNFRKDRKITTEDSPQPAFIMARFLSMSGETFDIAAAYNDISRGLPEWARRVLLYHITPHMRKTPYMRYIKSNKEKRTDKEILIIDKIQNYYSCKPIHAEQIFDLLKAQNIKPGNFFGV